MAKNPAWSAKTGKRITEKMHAFAENYARIHDPIAAYKIAYGEKYSDRAASSAAAALLRDPRIQAVVAEVRAAVLADTTMDEKRLVNLIAEVATSDIRSAFTENGRLKRVQDWDPAFARSVQSIKVSRVAFGEENEDGETGGQVETIEVKLWPKVPALDMLGRYLGIFEKDNKQKQPLTLIAELGPEKLRLLKDLIDARRAERVPRVIDARATAQP